MSAAARLRPHLGAARNVSRPSADRLILELVETNRLPTI